MERLKVQKELDKEGVAPTEKFITSGYQAHLEAMNKLTDLEDKEEQ